MDTKLYNKLEGTFGYVKEVKGIYIIYDFGAQFGIQETDRKINLIYKGKIIKSYPNNESTIRSVCNMLYGCSFVESTMNGEMFTVLHCGTLNWYSPNPFSTGTLSIGKGVYEHKEVVEDEYIDQPLSITDVVKEIFKRLPYLPVLSFKYDGRVFTYINKKIK